MNADMQEKLQKYMMETGYYNEADILVDFDGKSRADAKMIAIFGSQDLKYEDMSQYSAEFRAAFEFNQNKDREADAVEAEALTKALETPDEDLTNEQWQALVSAGYARTAQYAGDDSYQGYTYYVRTAKYDREYPLFASDETEEDLTAKGL